MREGVFFNYLLVGSLTVVVGDDAVNRSRGAVRLAESNVLWD
jgi:hypothetical protein